MHTLNAHRSRRLSYRTAQPGTGETLPTPSGGGGGGAPAATFTQDDIDRVAAREKDQGRRAALRELATSLGFQTQSEIEAYVTAKRAEEEAALTDAQRREADLAAREAAAAAKDAAAEAKAREVKIRVALLAVGAANGQDLEDAVALLRVPADATDDDLAAAAAALKARRPEFFAAPTAPLVRTPDGSPGSRPPANGGTPPVDRGSRGRAEAEKRYGAKAQTTGSSA